MSQLPPSPQRRPPNLLLVPYDWRLSNRYNGHRLANIVEPALERWRNHHEENAEARLVFVCHSIGGLVARWYIEMCHGAQITRKLITIGTPWRGAAKSLIQLVNGVPTKLGPLSIDLTTFACSLISAEQLLPEYAAIDHSTSYATTTEAQLPGFNDHDRRARLADAMRFHTDLQAAEQARDGAADMTHMIVGVRQPTITTVRFDRDHAVALETFGDENDYGDGTVPLTGALGHNLTMDTNRVVRIRPPRQPAAQPDRTGSVRRSSPPNQYAGARSAKSRTTGERA